MTFFKKRRSVVQSTTWIESAAWGFAVAMSLLLLFLGFAAAHAVYATVDGVSKIFRRWKG